MNSIDNSQLLGGKMAKEGRKVNLPSRCNFVQSDTRRRLKYYELALLELLHIAILYFLLDIEYLHVDAPFHLYSILCMYVYMNLENKILISYLTCILATNALRAM